MQREMYLLNIEPYMTTYPVLSENRYMIKKREILYNFLLRDIYLFCTFYTFFHQTTCAIKLHVLNKDEYKS